MSAQRQRSPPSSSAALGKAKHTRQDGLARQNPGRRLPLAVPDSVAAAAIQLLAIANSARETRGPQRFPAERLVAAQWQISRQPQPQQRPRPRGQRKKPHPQPEPERNCRAKHQSEPRPSPPSPPSQPLGAPDQVAANHWQIVVERLTKNVNEDHLWEIFGHYGHIRDLDLPLNRQCTSASRLAPLTPCAPLRPSVPRCHPGDPPPLSPFLLADLCAPANLHHSQHKPRHSIYPLC